jgi:hypothetical protein
MGDLSKTADEQTQSCKAERRAIADRATPAISWETLRMTAQFGEAMISMVCLNPQRAVWKPR